MKSVKCLLLLIGACAIADALKGKDKWRTDICKCINIKPKVCTPASTKMEDCNTCTCTRDGMKWKCESKVCPKPVCEPTTTKKEDCNTCTCSGDGMKWECETNMCPKPICEPTTTKMEDCNTCTCSGDGMKWECETNVCPKPICEPTTTKKEDCNTCTCSGDGMKWECETNVCPKPICEPTTTKKEDCNTCTCSGDGMKWECETNVCPKPICEPTTTKKEDCNTCTCSGDGMKWECETNVCPKPICEPTTTKKEDCNTCTCSGDGMKWECETNVCPKPICEPTTTKKEDCNTCTCSGDGMKWECETNVCPKPICEPTTTKKEDCNTCTCSGDGMKWECETNVCPKPICEPTTTKKEDCNTCTCSGDGMKWECETNVCPKPICEPTTTKKEDCNTCTCSGDGMKWECETNVCPKPICEPTTTKKEDCNTCTCSGDGMKWECETNMCPKPICEPTTTKMEDCNTCTCSGDGMKWECETNVCPKPICEPTTTKKEDCNTCTCSGDGMKWECETNVCPKPICEPTTTKKEDCNTCTCSGDGMKWECENNVCPPIIPPKDPQPTGICLITVAGKYVHLSGGDNTSGTIFDIYAYNGGAAQQMTLLDDGTVRVFEKCMEVKDGEVDNASLVQLNECNDGDNQQWVFLSNGQLRNPISNRCLDVLDGIIDNWQPLVINDCSLTDFPTQAFETSCRPIMPPEVPQPTGYCSITVADKCVYITGGDGTSGTLFDIYGCDGDAVQPLTVPGDGTVRAFDKCMEVKMEDGAIGNSASLQLNDCNEDYDYSQQWVFLSSGQIVNPISNRCLDVQGGEIQDGLPLIINDCRTTDFASQAFDSSCQPIIPPKDPQPTGICLITVAGKYVHLSGGDNTSGTIFDIYSYNGGAAQQMTLLDDGTVRVFEKCMEVKDSETDNASLVQLNECNDGDNQQWVFLSNGQLRNPISNRCLDVLDGIIDNWQPLVINDCSLSDFPTQAFETSCRPITPPEDPQPTGYCSITVADKCVYITGGDGTSGTLFDIYGCDEDTDQPLTVPGDGTLRAFDKCMEVKMEDGAISNSASLQLNDCNEDYSQQWVFLSSGQIVNPISNRCLDVQGGEIQDGLPLIINDCRTTDFASQAFESSCQPIIPPKDPQPTGICLITVAGKYVHLSGGDNTSGTIFDIYAYNGGAAQQMTLLDDGTVRVFEKCMEVKDSETDNASLVQLNECNDGDNQQWVFLSNGQLRNPISNRCLDVLDGIIDNWQPLVINDCSLTDFPTQTFETSCRPIMPRKDPQPTGKCDITVSGKCVSVTGGDSASGTLFEINSCDGGAAQQMTLLDDGTVKAFAKCMEVQDGAIENGALVQLSDCNEDYSQEWIFLSSRQLLNPISNRCLDVQGDEIHDGLPLIISDCGQSDSVNQVFESSCSL